VRGLGLNPAGQPLHSQLGNTSEVPQPLPPVSPPPPSMLPPSIDIHDLFPPNMPFYPDLFSVFPNCYEPSVIDHENAAAVAAWTRNRPLDAPQYSDSNAGHTDPFSIDPRELDDIFHGVDWSSIDQVPYDDMQWPDWSNSGPIAGPSTNPIQYQIPDWSDNTQRDDTFDSMQFGGPGVPPTVVDCQGTPSPPSTLVRLHSSPPPYANPCEDPSAPSNSPETP